jgi:hypothetical protein
MRLYCKGMASDDRRQGGSIYQTKFLIRRQIYRKKMLKTRARKESVTEELYYVRNEGFWATLLLWWTC